MAFLPLDLDFSSELQRLTPAPAPGDLLWKHIFTFLGNLSTSD